MSEEGVEGGYCMRDCRSSVLDCLLRLTDSGRLAHMPPMKYFSLPAALMLVLLPSLGHQARETSQPEVRLIDSPGSPFFGTFEVLGLAPEFLNELGSRELSTEEWNAVFAVYTGSSAPDETARKPAVTGSYEIDQERLRFRPRYPLVGGLAYTARLEAGEGSALVDRFSLPEPDREPTTVVTQVYPTAGEVPENLLRLYVYFSAPMSRGEAYDHVRLFRQPSGEPVARPFVEIAEELWDPGMRRLTLLFDPGRIKRGLRPHEEAGPPLLAGSSYRLVIDARWPDARGVPLKASFEKELTVRTADRTSPTPEGWHLEPPTVGSQEPVVLSFPEPLDQGLLQRVLTVYDRDGRQVPGEVEIRDEERQWGFRPRRPWHTGVYEVRIGTILEDLAGNNLRYVFDVDLDEPAEPGARGETVSLPFTPSSTSP